MPLGHCQTPFKALRSLSEVCAVTCTTAFFAYTPYGIAASCNCGTILYLKVWPRSSLFHATPSFCNTHADGLHRRNCQHTAEMLAKTVCIRLWCWQSIPDGRSLADLCLLEMTMKLMIHIYLCLYLHTELALDPIAPAAVRCVTDGSFCSSIAQSGHCHQLP